MRLWTRARRWAGLFLVGGLLGGAGLWVVQDGRRFHTLAPTLVETVLVEDLSLHVESWEVRAPTGVEPVRRATVQPAYRGVLDRGPRPALVTPPGTELHVHRRVPASTSLAFAVGVQGRGVREAAAGLRFDVEVDGRNVYSQTLNPAARRRDRYWIEARVDLGQTDQREVEIVLRTTVDGAGPPAGMAGWNNVRLEQHVERPRQRAAVDAPNVLVLLVDTLRADALGCYGAAPSPSPTADALAVRGIRFAQAIAQAPWTMPSVASVFTGLHPRSHGVTGGEEGAASTTHTFLADALTTLAEAATHAGISTFGVSTNPLVSHETNLTQGFETFFEFTAGKDAAGRIEWTSATRVNGLFLDWLAVNRGYRFLGYLHYMEAHHPYVPARAHVPAPVAGIRPEVVDGDVSEWRTEAASPAGLKLTAPEVQHLRQLYAGDVATFDDALATLLSGLERAGVADRTIVVLTADHGEEFEEHGRLGHGFHLYDELLHVPLLVAGPGISPGVRADQVQGIDLLPTILARLGVSPPPGLPGHDVLSPSDGRPAVSEVLQGVLPDLRTAPLVSIREGGWKLIAAPNMDTFLLFDLASDPSEVDNRYGPAPEGFALRAALDAFLRESPAPPEERGGDTGVVEKLRALGYAE